MTLTLTFLNCGTEFWCSPHIRRIRMSDPDSPDIPDRPEIYGDVPPHTILLRRKLDCDYSCRSATESEEPDQLYLIVLVDSEQTRAGRARLYSQAKSDTRLILWASPHFRIHLRTDKILYSGNPEVRDWMLRTVRIIRNFEETTTECGCIIDA